MISAKIVNGPSKFDLMLALFNRKVVNQEGVIFTVADVSLKLSAVITGVAAEDGSGESWNLTGYVRPAHDPMVPPNNVKMWFRTDTRKGHMDFID